jgi:hypothetical protein
MKRSTLPLVLLPVLAALLATGCQAPEEAPAAAGPAPAAAAPAAACPACEKGMGGTTIWCEGCNRGFISGESKSCRGCVDASLAGGSCAVCTASK